MILILSERVGIQTNQQLTAPFTCHNIQTLIQLEIST